MRASTSAHRSAVALALAAEMLGGCARRPTGTPWARVHEVTPAFLTAATAADPSLAVDRGGRVALTWVTRDSAGADAWLSVSADSGGHWSEPARLNPFQGMVSSFPESRPVAAWGRDGLLVAAWAATRPSRQGTGDDMAARVSADGGRSWGAMHLVNDDRVDPTSGYHGFAAVDVLPDGRPIVAWIDGRASAGLADEPELAEIYASASADGGVTWSPDVWIAGDVCACCRIAMRSAQRLNGTIDVAVAYRGATNQLRDPRVVVSHDAGHRFMLDTLISVDRWKLPG
ncbi:MAG TPA: sialidase family protein, partial [Verrucomicrobiae bacterium]|nr:sialidase family protein [Verrucomicrobiae bacterium]